MSFFNKHMIVLSVLFSISRSALACDLCALYSAAGEHETRAGSFELTLAEQYTYFGTTQASGDYLAGQPDEHLSSFITQVVGSYGISDRIALELHLPVIYRRFRRLEGEELVRDSVDGLGDISLVMRATAFSYSKEDFSASLNLLAGVKLPTGDSDQLAGQHDHETVEADQVDEHEHHAADHEEVMALHYQLRHAGHEHGDEISSAIHGHDLALGSGSVDVPLGAELFLQNGRGFASAALHYTIRTEGDHQYEFADDFLWSTGLGYYLQLSDDAHTALSLNLSGEIKDKDKSAGEREPDTAINSKFIGPELSYSTERLALQLGVDLPMNIENSGTQVVADYRIRAGFTYRF